MKRELPHAIDFELADTILRGSDGVQDLHVFDDGEVFYSCWAVPFWQRFRVLFTGLVWLGIMSRSHPPVRVDVYPFYEEGAEE